MGLGDSRNIGCKQGIIITWLYWGGQVHFAERITELCGKNCPLLYWRCGCRIDLSVHQCCRDCLAVAEKGIVGLSQYTDRSCIYNLAIDEVGREPMDAKHFGTGINAIQTVLQLRYEQRYCFYTHMTTNLDPDKEFSQRYGDYIADRVKEMFNVIKIEGESRR